MAKSLLQKLVGIVSIFLLAVSSLTVFAVPRASADYPGGDCDANAVIRCGVNSISELKSDYRANQGGDVKAIFSHFSMKNEAAFDGMVKGRVTKTNEIWVGNEKVATGAVTAGRQRMGADEVKVPGANAWMRPPSRSFRSGSLEAFVKMQNGRFHSAVIMSCGNPVNAYPVDKPAPQPAKPKPQPEKPQLQKPSLSIQKKVRVLGESDWKDTVTVNPGDQVQFQITVKNTGETDLREVWIHDSLPGGVSFEDAALDGPQEVTEFQVSELVGGGVTLATLPKDRLTEIRFIVTVGSNAGRMDASGAVESNGGTMESGRNADGSGGYVDRDTDNDGYVDDTAVVAGDEEVNTADVDDAVECDDTRLRNVAHAKAKDVPEEEADAFVQVICQQEQEEQPAPQVKAKQTPPAILPETGAAGAIGAFSVTSLLGWAAYKLKEFYSIILR